MILIDYKDRRPIYEQIVEKFQHLIMKGILDPGSQLPSVRSLAIDLSINPNTIQRAYGELERLGYIYSVKGKGNFASDINSLLPKRKAEFLKSLDILLLEADSLGFSKKDIILYLEKNYEEEHHDRGN